MPERFWSDDFDMDLPKLIALDEVLGAAADIRLWTHGGTSHGRLNHPSVWAVWAYFGFSPETTGKPDSYSTSNPIVECTWREVVRDAWPHTYVVVVNGQPVWDAHRWASGFTELMYDLRGWSRLPDGQADKLRGQVRASLTAATEAFTEIVKAARKVVADA